MRFVLFAVLLVALAGLGGTYSSAEEARVVASPGTTAPLLGSAMDSAQTIRQIARGSTVTVVTRTARFSRVTVGGTSGWMRNEDLAFDRRRVVVVAPRTNGYLHGVYPERQSVSLPYGEQLVVQSVQGEVAFVARDGLQGQLELVVPTYAVRGCNTDESSLFAVQMSLNSLGFDAGRVDGQVGPRTLTAVAGFLESRGIETGTLQQSCAFALVLHARERAEVSTESESRFQEALNDALLPASLRQARRRAQQAFDNRDCERLIALDADVLNGLTAESCREHRTREEYGRLALQASETLDCDALASIPEPYRTGYSVETCMHDRRIRETERLFEQSLARGDCGEAERIAQSVSRGHERVTECRRSAQRVADLAALERAMTEGDCDTVARLEGSVATREQTQTCRFPVLMASHEPRTMFLAAASFDAAGDTARARLLYEEIMRRFAQDDLAVQSALRLTALNDQITAQAARADLQSQMQRMRDEAVAAQRRAEEAQRAAQAARSTAPSPSTTASRTRQSSCAHLRVGQTVWYAGFGQQPTLNSLLGWAGRGFDHVISGLNHETGTAFLVSLENNRPVRVSCQQLR